MNKSIIKTSILCTILALGIPISKNISAQSSKELNSNKKIIDEKVSVNINSEIKDKNYIDEKVHINKESHNDKPLIDNVSINSNSVKKSELNSLVTGDIIDKKVTENEVSDNEATIEIKHEILSEGKAKGILENRYPNLEFSYQGNEETFNVLKNSDISGYVYLANIDGDMGYLVDKNTKDIYSFHPSGYMEKLK